MSQSQESSTSATTVLTILSINSPTPPPPPSLLSDATTKAMLATKAKLVEISNFNSLQTTELNYENLCAKNDPITATPDLVLENGNIEMVRFNEAMTKATEELGLENSVENSKEYDAQAAINGAKSDKIENADEQTMMMSELFEISASIRETKAPSVANDRAIVIKDGVDNHHHQHQHDDDAEEECVELANEEVKVNLTNGAEEKCASNSDRRMEEVIKNGENFQLIGSDQLISAISIETNGEAQRARSLECQSARTVSESPPGATDSWKNATVNMNHSIPIPITHSAHNTTPRSHQTKVIFNNEALNLGEVIHHHPLFVKNTSKYWYKPAITREEAVSMLRDKPPGTFVVRDSNSFPGAFGLALKVSTPPPGVNPGDGTELVRHFLIEPSPKGVKLRGCNNEPVFGTLSALVYQHSIIPLALPTKLLLPEYDPANTPEHISAAQQLLQQGAACNVTYVISLDTESLTGPEAVRRCIDQSFELLKQKMIHPVPVHFKVSSQGITITDNTRQLFFRRHYPVQSVTYAGLDPSDRRWDNSYLDGSMTKYVRSARILAFVARKIGSRTDNTCHIFAELEPEQPATAVVNFITKVMMGCK